MPFSIIFNKQQIYYDFHPGEPGKPVLLMVHGAAGGAHNWPDLLRPLIPYPTYILDLPGHGRSHPPGCRTIAEYADVVAAFMQGQLSQQPVVLVGHSMGGAIAQELALRLLSQVVGLVLIGTSARLGVSPTILDNVLDTTQVAIDFVAKYGWSPSAPKQLVQEICEQQAAITPEVFYGDFLACNTFDLRGRLGEVRIPALVISGSADRMVPEKYGRSLASELPNAQFHSVTGSGHYTMLENPDAVARQMKDFLQTI